MPEKIRNKMRNEHAQTCPLVCVSVCVWKNIRIAKLSIFFNINTSVLLYHLFLTQTMRNRNENNKNKFEHIKIIIFLVGQKVLPQISLRYISKCDSSECVSRCEDWKNRQRRRRRSRRTND